MCLLHGKVGGYLVYPSYGTLRGGGTSNKPVGVSPRYTFPTADPYQGPF